MTCYCACSIRPVSQTSESSSGSLSAFHTTVALAQAPPTHAVTTDRQRLVTSGDTEAFDLLPLDGPQLPINPFASTFDAQEAIPVPSLSTPDPAEGMLLAGIGKNGKGAWCAPHSLSPILPPFLNPCLCFDILV
jgi:hypothetical protein